MLSTAKHPLVEHPSKAQRYSRQLDDEDDAKKDRTAVLGELLDYRDCASGVVNKDADSFASPPT